MFASRKPAPSTTLKMSRSSPCGKAQSSKSVQTARRSQLLSLESKNKQDLFCTLLAYS